MSVGPHVFPPFRRSLAIRVLPANDAAPESSVSQRVDDLWARALRERGGGELAGEVVERLHPGVRRGARGPHRGDEHTGHEQPHDHGGGDERPEQADDVADVRRATFHADKGNCRGWFDPFPEVSAGLGVRGTGRKAVTRGWSADLAQND